ncbi:MAG TPA: isochorismatase family protein [Chloroflexota bacterium]|jgi:nicotinamidase-related amidase
MARVRPLIALALVSITALSFPAPASLLAEGTRLQPSTPDVLAVPDPVAVSLDVSTTAFLAIDFLDSNCGPNPNCVATLPAVAAGLKAARAASVPVIYAVHPPPDTNILADVAPMADDPVFVATPGDKFFNSDLDIILKEAGITFLVIAGTASNAGVLYTAAAATQRGYTVVVAQDGISGGGRSSADRTGASTSLATPVALWQLLNGLSANPQNAPLQPARVTLSRTDLISYQ